VVGLFAWLSLELGLVGLHFSSSFGPPTPFELAIKARPGRFLAMLVFGPSPLLWLFLLVMAWGWLKASIHLHHRPRTSLPVEARRAAVMGSFPALVLGALAYAAGPMGYAPDGVLVAPPAMAAAGTVVVVVFGAALWLRLRRPPPDDVTAPSRST